jgi:hypothetical protein
MLRVFSKYLFVASLGILVFLPQAQAEDAEVRCEHWHDDPFPTYTGPVGVGLNCEDAAAPLLSWTIPDSISTVRFHLDGADDAVSETTGGTIEATLDLIPGSILTLEVGGEGEASAVLSGTEPLLIAAGGNGRVTNYAAPSARDVAATVPGPGSGQAFDGSIFIEWTHWHQGEPTEGSDPPPKEDVKETPPDASPAAGPQIPATSPPCIVPRLRGLKPSAARRALAAAHCTLGRIARRWSSPNRRGRVIRQASPAGVVLPTGAGVDVIVGRRP